MVSGNDTTTPTFYTCSYTEFRPEMGVPVQASLGRPKFNLKYDLRESLWPFTPRGKYLRSDSRTFEAEMVKQMDRYGVPYMVDALHQIRERANGLTPVILCFERLNTGKWCHRSIVSDWWTARTGEVVPELGAEMPPYEPPAPSLF